MTLDKLRKPYKGLHWWYRILTGTKYTFAVQGSEMTTGIKPNGYQIYWKQNIKTKEWKSCSILNFLVWLDFRIKDIKNLRYIKF